MNYQNVSFKIDQPTRDSVKKLIADMTALLPFLITLDAQQRMALTKLGPKSADFVNDANTALKSFPGIAPSAFDSEEFFKDTELFAALYEIKVLLDSLAEKVDNTYIAVGSEAMTAALEIYAYIQTAADRTPGLQSIADKMKERFKPLSRRKPKTDGEQPKP